MHCMKGKVHLCAHTGECAYLPFPVRKLRECWKKWQSWFFM